MVYMKEKETTQFLEPENVFPQRLVSCGTFWHLERNVVMLWRFQYLRIFFTCNSLVYGKVGADTSLSFNVRIINDILFRISFLKKLVNFM